MESETNNEQFSAIKLGDILTTKEISDVRAFFKKKDLKGARAYLNEPERKKRLEEKGVVADYVYYNFELYHLTNVM